MLLADSGQVEPCFVEHLFQLSVGRPVDELDAETLEVLTTEFTGSGTDLAELLAAFVSTEAFAYRRVPTN